MVGIAPLILAGSSIASAGLGALASSRTAAANERINAANIAAQQRENFLQRVLADRLLNLQLQPTTDAFGNRAEYIPGVGFVTTLSPEIQALQNASLREQMLRLTQDAAGQREGLERSVSRGRDEDAQARALLDEFNRVQPVNRNELFQLLLNAGREGFNQTFDRALQGTLRQNLRAGGSAQSGADIIARFSAEAAAPRADMATNARLQALTGAEDIYNQRRGNRANLYNLFAQRAQNSFGNAPFTPETISPTATSLSTAQRSGALGASQLAALLGRSSAPQGAFLQPNFGTASAVKDIGKALQELFTIRAEDDKKGDASERRLGNT